MKRREPKEPISQNEKRTDFAVKRRERQCLMAGARGESQGSGESSRPGVSLCWPLGSNEQRKLYRMRVARFTSSTGSDLEPTNRWRCSRSGQDETEAVAQYEICGTSASCYVKKKKTRVRNPLGKNQESHSFSLKT